MGCLHEIKMKLRNYEWRRANRHNHTTMVNDFDMSQVEVGKHTYGGLKVFNDRTDVKLKIGNYCSIAENVVFMVGLDHPTNYISTYPFKVLITGSAKHEAISKGDIIIDDDVWIGYGVIIMSGVHIRQGAIIAAGAVVTKDVPAYAIVGGVPAKILRYKFEQPLIEKMLGINYGKITKDVIEQNINVWYTKIENEIQLESLLKQIKCM